MVHRSPALADGARADEARPGDAGVHVARRHDPCTDVLTGSRARPEALVCVAPGSLVRVDVHRVQVRRGVRAALLAARRAGFALGLAVVDGPGAVELGKTLQGLLGPFDAIVAAPVEPLLVALVADELGVEARRCVVVGANGAEVAAAYGAGAVGVLVPNEDTMPLECRGVAHVYGDLLDAVRDVSDWTPAAARMGTPS